jgi:hypothetical protein
MNRVHPPLVLFPHLSNTLLLDMLSHLATMYLPLHQHSTSNPPVLLINRTITRLSPSISSLTLRHLLTLQFPPVNRGRTHQRLPANRLISNRLDQRWKKV